MIIVDYGAGNIASIRNKLRKLGHPAVISADPGKVALAGRLILPGVSAFNYGMARLEEIGLAKVLARRVCWEGRPFLGPFLEAQLLGWRIWVIPALLWRGTGLVKTRGCRGSRA